MKKITVAVFLLLLMLSPLHASDLSDMPDQSEIDRIIDKVDRIFRSDSSRAKMTMRIETENWQRSLEMNIWSEGLDKTFVRIISPKKETGTATLRVDNEMWNYFPKINKTMKVPPSMMMSSWMGSDFTNDDLVKESSLKRDYTYSLIKGEDTEHYYVELIPKEDSPIVWGRIVVKARKHDYIPVKQTFYDEKDRLMRVMNLKDIRPMGGKTIPTVMELIPTNKPGNRTIVTYHSAEFDMPLPKDTFTLRNLQRRR